MVKEFIFSKDEAKVYARYFSESLASLSRDIVKITKAQSILGQLLIRCTENSDIRIDEITDVIGEKPHLLERISMHLISGEPLVIWQQVC